MPITMEAPVESVGQSEPSPEESDLADTASVAADLLDQGAAEPEPDEPNDVEPVAAGEAPDEPTTEQADSSATAAATTEVTQVLGCNDRNRPTLAWSAVLTGRISITQRQREIASLEEKYVDLCLEINQTESEIDELKDHLKTLQKEFAELSVELRSARNSAEWQPRLPLIDKPEGESPLPATDQSAVAETPAEPPAEGQQRAEAWRDASIDELGLAPKLAEKLVEAGCDTIGRLENLRAEISQGREKWPKGVGPAKVTNIEDAVIDWLTKHRDVEAFTKAGEMLGIQPTPVDPPAEDTVPAPATPAETTDLDDI